MNTLWEAIQQVNNTLLQINSSIKGEIVELKQSTQNLSTKVQEQNEKILKMETEIKQLQDLTVTLVKDKEIQERRMEYLENNGRRNNLRLLNFPKSPLIPSIDMLRKYFSEILGIPAEGYLPVTRAQYISGAVRPTKEQPQAIPNLNLTEFLENSLDVITERTTLIVTFALELDRNNILRLYFRHLNDCFLGQKNSDFPRHGKEHTKEEKGISTLQNEDSFVILGEIRQCGLLDTQTCLKSVTLSTERGEMMLEIHSSGAVLLNKVIIQLPFSSAILTLFQPSTFYITLQTAFGLTLQVQLVPIMQVFMTLSEAYKTQTLGLCGNYNDIPTDDFITMNELVEETASSFGNTWKSHSLCPNVKDVTENPCATSVIKEKYMHCPATMTYRYHGMTGCNQTCWSLTNFDIACQVHYMPVDGCGCPTGTFLDDNNQCVNPMKCPCYYKGLQILSGEAMYENDIICVCGDRKWECSDYLCHGTCTVYGDGHHTTFDKKRFDFIGACSYVLVQDLCDRHQNYSTFSIVTENIVCGITPRICSKIIRIFLGNVQLKLHSGKYEMQERGHGITIPFRMYPWGLYIVIEASNGLMLIWDKKTTIYIKLDSYFRGKVCGLCGNFDDNQNNDFMSRGKSIEESAEEFGNSWKISSSCPDAKAVTNPCFGNPHRRSQAERQCSIINSAIFKECHTQVNPASYYHTCLWDACICQTTNDFECLCTAIAAYAAACNEVQICIHWRLQNFCPIYCEPSNLTTNEYSWHYKACGIPCLRTCRNPSNKCSEWLPRLEGCYPFCPAELPYFDEIELTCVSRQDCTPCSLKDPGCLADFKEM
ncbi:mucin-2 [Microcaecilia unicolor]|uniref:Mucin-2-like n=1 Tax=Microcaecilia unicolor TaxID=1415580 RepID=A0A6P7Y5E2_9AMPH|nr:mucin-2-like [Microcaecilia unicolor]